MTCAARRVVLAVTLAGVPGALRGQQAPPAAAPIGTARMEADGTIVLDLVAGQGSTQGHGRLTYPPDHTDYEMILRHVGGLRPGELKPVRPFP